MKTTWRPNGRGHTRGGRSLLQRILLAFLIVAFLFASLPAPGVFAKSGDTEDAAAIERLEAALSRKIRVIREQRFFYDHVRLYPADFKTTDDLARAHHLLNRYGFALRQAETVLANHYGFDNRGRVTDLILAAQTIHDLADYLHLMRALRIKLDQVPRARS